MRATVISPFVRRWGSGNGPNVMLIHGLSAYSATWWRIGSRLAAHGCVVSAPDLRGHGQSPSTESYRFDEMTADLISLGDSWDLVVGHSLGGPIACALTARSSAIGALLLLDPFLDTPDEEFESLVDEQLSELDPDATSETVAVRNPSWHPEDCFHKAISARATSRYVVERCLRDNAPYHHLGMLDELRIPTTILGSDPAAGALFPPQTMDRVENPLVDYLMLEGAGHSLQRERPEAVGRHALDLIRGV